MKFLNAFLTLTAVSVSAAVKIPGEGAYSTSNLADLPEEPTNVSHSLANNLLDVLENYGLTKNFGVVAVHNHINLAAGEIMFQHGNATGTQQAIAVYDDVKANGVPYNYRITTGDVPLLLHLDLGDITSDVLAARTDLVTAMAGNFLKDFSAAAVSHLVGFAYIQPLDRMALENGGVVKNHYNHAHAAGTASTISLTNADPNDAPSFFTRGVGNSTAASDITILCKLCGILNPWKNSK
ncbi:hypothetical protein C8R45DRAFT_1011008 [Mycena sanguinolenta]|nr:hypothetical protein C8R45DRAFT_1011008 [Mycena sanguinolenta]